MLFTFAMSRSATTVSGMLIRSQRPTDAVQCSLRGSQFIATNAIENFTCFDSKFNRNDRTTFISSLELSDAMNYICAKSFENLYSSYNKLTRYEYTDGVSII